MNKRVLVIAYVFPPIAYAGTHRTLRLCKYLARKGYNITVLTINVSNNIDNDFSLMEGISEQMKVYRTKTYDPVLYYHRNLKSRILRKKFGAIINRLITKPLQLVNQPDHMVGWIPFAVAKALKLIKKKKIDIVYTTSPPHSTQITGYLLKKIRGIKWIADLRDPILDNISSESMSFSEIKVLQNLESKIVKNADFIISNTKTAQKRLANRYRVKNVVCINNSYDPEDFNNISNGKYDNYTLSHVGSLYSFRKIDLLINAIKNLKQQDLISPDFFKVKLIGLVDKSIYDEIKKAGINDYFDLVGLVSHQKAIEIMVKSNALLLVKATGNNSGNQIPGKLFEYIGAGKRIIYIGPKDTEAALILQEYGLGEMVHNDEGKLCEVLVREYKKYKNEINLNEDNNKDIKEKYSSVYMVEKFENILNKL